MLAAQSFFGKLKQHIRHGWTDADKIVDRIAEHYGTLLALSSPEAKPDLIAVYAYDVHLALMDHSSEAVLALEKLSEFGRRFYSVMHDASARPEDFSPVLKIREYPDLDRFINDALLPGDERG